MINLFGKNVKCGAVLLEYSEDRALDDFDLSASFTNQFIDDTIQTNYPDLLEKSKALFAVDRNAGVMLDHFVNQVVQPSFVSLIAPKDFLSIFDIEAPELPTENYYASVLHVGRNNELRFVYHDPSNPGQTNVVDAANNLLFHENVFTGNLPAELQWANDRVQQLEDAGVKVKINHYKLAEGYKPKVYFLTRYNW